MALPKNRCLSLAQRAAAAGWTLERVNVEIAQLEPIQMPTSLELDAARDILGSSELSFRVAAALDMLFDASIPGIPEDADHYTGNVDYYLAVAWLDRVKAGEEQAEDFFWRRCRSARKFYSTWEPASPGAVGHPAWADVLQLEAALFQHAAERTKSVSELRESVELLEEACSCYPPGNKLSWPAFFSAASSHLKLAEHESPGKNLRRALELARQARECFEPADPDCKPVILLEAFVWKALSERKLTQAGDIRRVAELLERVESEKKPDSHNPFSSDSLRDISLTTAESIRSVAGRILNLLRKLIDD